MRLLNRYLFREFATATLATLAILLMVSMGGVFAKVLADIAAGKVPAGMMLAQLGLQLFRYLPLILPLGLTLGLMLAVGRLHRDSEMPVLTAVGVGPRALLKPLMLLVVPVMIGIALCSIWLGPWAKRTSKAMIAEANRSLVVTGLRPGRFTELAGGNGVVYVGSMSNDGADLQRVFVYRQNGDRLDVTTAMKGHLTVHEDGQRLLQLDDGFRVEGPRDIGLDFRLMRYVRNELGLPDSDGKPDPNDPQQMSLSRLMADPRVQARAEFHHRIAPPLLALAFALLAVPLARSSPRDSRYGRAVMGFLAYMFGMNLMQLGTSWLEDGKLPIAAGLWWLILPLLAVGLWMYLRDGAIKRPPRRAQARKRSAA